MKLTLELGRNRPVVSALAWDLEDLGSSSYFATDSLGNQGQIIYTLGLSSPTVKWHFLTSQENQHLKDCQVLRYFGKYPVHRSTGHLVFGCQRQQRLGWELDAPLA